MSHTPIVHDNWNTYASHVEGKPLFISFDVDAAQNDLSATRTQCARILIRMQKPNDAGGPVSPEAERLYEMEDQLCAKLTEHRVECRLVGRLTCDGVRELVFQLDDWGPFRPAVGLWMMENEDYELDVSEHEGWTFFNEMIRPSEQDWLYIADCDVVRNLLKAGSDPSKPHDIEFVFVGDDAKLRPVADALQGRGYAPLKANPTPGTLVMVKTMLLDQDDIFLETLAHRELAAANGVAYDGWGAAVVR